MLEHQDPDTREALIRRALLVAAAVLLLAAIAPELRHPSDIHLGRSQILLIGLGILVGMLGVLGPRRDSAYRGAAIMLLNTGVLLAVIEVAATAINFALGESQQEVPVEFASARSNPWFSGKAWADSFWAEADRWSGTQNYQPYVMWHSPPANGTYLRVDREGHRVTPQSVCSPAGRRILVFGSSATWGWGVPDDWTIPARMQAELVRRRVQGCVVNVAQNGFVATQDLIELVRLVQHHERIDDAVFMHGFNDVVALLETGDAGAHFGIDRIRGRLQAGATAPRATGWLRSTATGRLVRRLVHRPASAPRAPRWVVDDDDVDSLTAVAVHAYLTAIATARGLAHHEGFRVWFFWQPYAGWSIDSVTREIARSGTSFDGSEKLVRSVYKAIADSTAVIGNLHFIADSFIGAPPGDWLDVVHLAPPANDRVARLIVAELLQPSDPEGIP